MSEHKSDSKDVKVSERSLTDKLRENPFILSTVALGLILIFLILGFSGLTGHSVSASSAGEMLIDYYESHGASGLKLDSVEEVSGVYKVNINYNNSVFPVYITKDGKFAGSLSSVVLTPTSSSSSTTTTEIPQTDVPVVELFVMSYCPYGTMAEKGVIPVAELLGDQIDFRIRFVDYLMHGEKEAEENLREYCIQEIAPEKYLDYLYCFLEGDGQVSSSGYITNGNDVDTCIAEAGVNVQELENCMAETDEKYGITEALNSGASYPAFGIESDLNDKYGVSGSPTLVVNGVIISVNDNGYYGFNDEMIAYSRSSETYKEIICALFNDAPEECETELSSKNPSVYFGWDESSSGSTAGVCN